MEWRDFSFLRFFAANAPRFAQVKKNWLEAPAKKLESGTLRWEIPTMTVVADNKKRVTIRLAKPGDRFDVQVAADGKFVLTRLEPVSEARQAKVRIERRGAYSVGVLHRPISEDAIREALNEFP